MIRLHKQDLCNYNTVIYNHTEEGKSQGVPPQARNKSNQGILRMVEIIISGRIHLISDPKPIGQSLNNNNKKYK